MKIEKERTIELETATVDGIRIDGHWNRMYMERTITDYSVELKEKIYNLPGAESFGWCYNCAQCVGVCPIYQVNGDYGPRRVIRMTENGIDLLSDENLWLCTSCANCLRVCPKEVDMLKIMPAAREEAMDKDLVPETVANELFPALENTAKYGNPMGESARKRAAWAKDIPDVEVPIMKDKQQADWLWFVGDYTSYHIRGKDTAKALARIYKAIGLDYGILGREEWSDGDSQRLTGEKGLFEMVAERNMEAFEKYEFNKIVVTGPHALNAIRNEYPKLEGGKEYPVDHYSVVLAENIDKFEFKQEIPLKVTFHDPCYLGRINGEYEAPRKLLKAIPGLELAEMGRCREQGYCCGGGGGGMWIDLTEKLPERLSERRVQEAVETGAQILAVTCPYEVSRFEDAVKSTGNEGNLIVRDIAELLDWAMGGDSPSPLEK